MGAQKGILRLSTWPVVGWVFRHLFSTWLNGAITLVLLWMLVPMLHGAVDWLFIHANWQGTTREACSGNGACWVFVSTHLKLFFYGMYPVDALWRVNVVFSFVFLFSFVF